MYLSSQTLATSSPLTLKVFLADLQNIVKNVSKLAWLQPSPVWRFILWVHAKSLQSCLTLCDLMDSSWDSPGKNTWVGCHALLQGIFLTRVRTHNLYISCIAGGFFTTNATWEAQRYYPIIIPLKCLWSIVHYHVIRTLFPYMLELHFSSALCFILT